jgi:hypothetical protein
VGAVKGMEAAFAANFPKGNCRVDLVRTHVRGRAGERAGSPQLTFCGADLATGWSVRNARPAGSK